MSLQDQLVTTSFHQFHYDYLILACGSNHSYFGHPEWEEYAPGLKTLEQATEIRRRVFLAFERAENSSDTQQLRSFLTFIVIGGGPTGVELAGALGEITRFSLSREFKHIDPSHTRIILLEGGPRILASYSDKLAGLAARSLEELGVQVWTNSYVTAITAEGVQVGTEFVKAATVLWAAGVKPSALNQQLGVELDKQGRIKVQGDCSIPGFQNAFVLGDQACFSDPRIGVLPGLAPVALQQGRFVAKKILGKVDGKAAFKYVDKGQMATVGRKKAVVDSFGLEFNGTLAWLAWLFIHIFYLIGFKNRVFVFYEWVWSYFTFKRGARLIVDKEWRTKKDTG